MIPPESLLMDRILVQGVSGVHSLAVARMLGQGVFEDRMVVQGVFGLQTL